MLKLQCPGHLVREIICLSIYTPIIASSFVLQYNDPPSDITQRTVIGRMKRFLEFYQQLNGLASITPTLIESRPTTKGEKSGKNLWGSTQVDHYNKSLGKFP